MKNKKLLATIILLSSCSVNETTSNTTMAPLTTIGVSKTVVVTEPSLPSSYFAFIDDVYYYYGHSSLLFSEDETIETGKIWCELISGGMKSEDVVMRINEGASDQNEANYHMAIVTSAVINICPNQKEKWSL